MGLFGKKEKKLCPICGNELKLFDSFDVSDGEICGSCEKMIRGKFNIKEYWEKRGSACGEDELDYILKTDDPLAEMRVEDIKEMIASMKEEQKEILEQVDSNYAHVAKVDDCFTIAPKALEVGLKRAKEYKNKYVATVQVISGTFAKGDAVTVTTRGRDIPTQILDVFACGSSTFETELATNMGKHKADAGSAAWIILNLSEGVEEGSLIQK